MPIFGGSDSVTVRIESSTNTTGIDKTSQSIDSLSNTASRNQGSLKKLHDAFLPLAAISASAGIAFDRLTGFMGDSIASANKFQNSLTGLNTIAKAFGKDANAAEQAAKDLAKDGLMTVADAATGLKNLLASGFELPQAIKLMERFKDTAAFNRQASLSFGDAIRSATEGIKNGNSILVDNAGVTKNLSVILEEAGYSAQDLMKATTDVNIRQALFNGLIKETTPMLGDAAKLTETTAGKQAQMAAQTEILKARIGEGLQPALLKLMEVVTPMIESFAKFTSDHPQLVAAFLIIGTTVVGLTALLGGLGLAITGIAPLVAAMQVASSGSLALLTKSFVGLQALVATPLIMPAIAIAAAVASIAVVYSEWKKVQSLQDEINRQQDSMSAGTTSYYQSLQRAVSEGRMTQSQANDKMKKYNANFQTFTGRAKGGHVQSGTPYLVGEEGQELFIPSSSGQIVPADKTSQAMGGQQITYKTEIGTVVLQDSSAVDRFFERLDMDNSLVAKGLAPVRGM